MGTCVMGEPASLSHASLRAAARELDVDGVCLAQVYVVLVALVRPIVKAPWTIFLVSLTQLITGCLLLLSSLLHRSPSSPPDVLPRLPAPGWLIAHIATTLALVLVTCLFPLEDQTGRPKYDVDEDADDKEADDGSDEVHRVSPEESVTLGSWIVFDWVDGLLKRGNRRTLGYADLWRLPSTLSSEGVLTYVRSLG